MPNILYAKATAGVYAEVMNQIYDSYDKRIREAVSNAYDANATQVKISVYSATREKRIIIYDNGDGMDEDDVKGKYINMGGGDNYNNENAIGRIGIGALSVFALGDKIKINTRKNGSNKVIVAELDLTNIKNDEKHSIPLENIPLGKITGYRDANEDDEDHFTEIIITDLSKPALKICESEESTKELIEKLERILPVKYRNDDVLFEKLPTAIKDKISKERYIVDVIFHSPNLGYDNYKIYRKSIFSEHKVKIMDVYPIHPFKIEDSIKGNLNVHGYLYVNAEKGLPKTWQGINARVKNVTIEGNTYFSYTDDSAARVRIGGELFINNIDENHAIQSNRSGFAIENEDYILISDLMHTHLNNEIALIRKNSNIDSSVKKVVNHLDKLCKVFEDSAAIEDEKANAEDFKNLDDSNVDIDEFELYSLEDNLRDELDETGFDFIWSGTIEDLYEIDFEEDDYWSIQINKRLERFVYNVSGNSIQYLLGYGGERKPLIIKKPGIVYINLDNELIPDKDICKVDVGFIKVVLILYLNYLRCDGNADVLYNHSIKDLYSLT